MRRISGLIFDLDGTLVTSSLDFKAIKEEIGCPADQDTLKFISELGHPAEQDAALDIVHRHEEEDAQASTWLPGAQRFLRACAHQKLPLAIVTRNSQRSSLKKIRNNNIPIGLIRTRENAPPKPDPTALHDIANVFSLPPHEVMMVGDYHHDIEAARRANMVSCLVNFDHLPKYAHLADYAFESFEKLHSAFFDGPKNRAKEVR